MAHTSDDTDEDALTIISPSAPLTPESIAATSPKKYVTIALNADIEVMCSTSTTRQTRPPFKSGPRTGDAQPDLIVEHTWIQGQIPKIAWFKLHFEDNRFKDALVQDAIGWPVELWANYSLPAPKRAKGEPEGAWEHRVALQEQEVMGRNYDYNDGKEWVNREPRVVVSTGALDDWLADLIPTYAAAREAARVKREADKARKAAKDAEKQLAEGAAA